MPSRNALLERMGRLAGILEPQGYLTRINTKELTIIIDKNGRHVAVWHPEPGLLKFSHEKEPRTNCWGFKKVSEIIIDVMSRPIWSEERLIKNRKYLRERREREALIKKPTRTEKAIQDVVDELPDILSRVVPDSYEIPESASVKPFAKVYGKEPTKEEFLLLEQTLKHAFGFTVYMGFGRITIQGDDRPRFIMWKIVTGEVSVNGETQKKRIRNASDLLDFVHNVMDKERRF